MSIGQEPIEKRPVVSLRVLTKNNRKRVDKKSGKKQPRQNDYDPVVEPAPDSAYLVNTPKTPSQVQSTQKSPQKSALKTKSKTPHSKKKLHFNLETVSEEEIDTCHISPHEKKDNIITLDDTPPGKKRKLDFPSPPISIEIEQEKKTTMECNCECGTCDSVEDMLGCEWQKGVKKCNIWKHFSCTGLKDGDTFLCSKHTTN
ncbi:Hypothetical predicted protein [Mytilus galloprovincialis]|uniref:Uncharacterized protein n=1 Tax=Mytilus galloprovincialis TaxID=29158 RepID=A0A8B6F8P7_MYTGA|nr:Hypothetical predicted protein [Mytilus galloprovincialis]